MRTRGWVLFSFFVLFAGCESTPSGDAPDAGVRSDASRSEDGAVAAADGGARVDGSSAPVDSGPPAACDYQSVDGIVVIEAESLALTESWARGTDGAIEYIEWTGPAHNNDPTNGVLEARVRLAAAGRYRLQWYTRVGRGTNATEHNDAWARFPDVDGFYGATGPDDAEDRVYPRPACDDMAFMDGIRMLPGIAEATCPNGSTRDGWFKVYSSGALDWRWSARTSDSDAHDVIAEVDAPGVYLFQLAARADFSQIDRIVIHEESLADTAVRDLGLAPTLCR